MVLFVFFCFCIYTFSWIAEKKDNKMFLVLAILAAGFLSGFRAGSVGWDTQNYLNIFYNIGRGIWSPNVELSFQYIAKFLLFFWNDPQWVLLVFALATNALIIYRFWTLRKLGSFSFMVLMYLVFYYLSTLNIMRQYLAIAIIFFATAFLDKKKYIPYLLCTVFACLLHTTAILGFALLPVYTLFSMEDKRLRKRLMILYLSLLPVVITAGVFLFLRYRNYLAQSNNSIGLMMPVRLVVLGLVWFFCVRKTTPGTYTNRRILPVITACALLGILITFCGYYTTTLSRMGLYFMLFEIPFIAYATQNGKYRIVPQGIYYLLLLYMIFLVLTGNGAGVWPFAFC